MTTAGQLSHRVSFQKRQDINPDAPDDLGNVQSVFVEQFVVAAKVQAKFGGEAVVAARLVGQQPVTIVVRQSSQTNQIQPDWRAVDARSGTEYAIRSIVDPDDGGAFWEILTQTGVAA
ncbi:head-tail adaptor protein [Tardiphaga sp. 367_B4_N1_1]|uniref:head-tail adaptor protein n=1 Tax=Tardiphaga sp. 367_B4_N1_1 TaxID=3240777 RepID=UPI003F23F397